MYINGVRISNTAFRFNTNSIPGAANGSPSLYIGYIPFKNGTYKYNRPWLKTTTKRVDNKQYAIENDFIDEYDLEWYDEHRYTITLVKTNDPNLKHKIGEKSYIEIICIINSNNYMFRSSRDGKNFTEIFTKID